VRLVADVVRALRAGSWITRPGLLVLCGSIAVVEALILASFIAQRALGSDFAVFYAASRTVGLGHLDALARPEGLTAVVESIVGRPLGGTYYWWYPPTFLLLLKPLASVPFPAAYVLVMLAGLAAYLTAIRSISPGITSMAAALLFPAVLVTLSHGQLSLLTTGVLAWSLVLLSRSPTIAGILLGALSFKPHLAMLAFLALAAGRHWRALACAVTTALGLALLSVYAFGPDCWTAFAATMPLARAAVEDAFGSHPGFQSVFGAVRLLGGSVRIAWAVQGTASASVLVLLGWTWSRPVAHELKAATLVLGTLVSTSFLWDYDLALMAAAGAFLARYASVHGWGDWERSALVGAFLAPLLLRTVARGTGIAIGPPAVLALLWLVSTRVHSSKPRLTSTAG
jgi:hypothetical protein